MSPCIIHLENTKDKVIPFYDNKKAWNKLLQVLHRWKYTLGQESQIAKDCIEKFGLFLVYTLGYLVSKCPSEETGLGYHRICYQRFTDISKITRAEEKYAKHLGGKQCLINIYLCYVYSKNAWFISIHDVWHLKKISNKQKVWNILKILNVKCIIENLKANSLLPQCVCKMWWQWTTH